MMIIKTIPKYIVSLIALNIAFTNSFCQKKNTVQQFKIRSTTVVSEDYEENIGKQKKESFTKYDALGQVIEEIDYDKK